jgi:Transposase DNA-binding/Transposase DDE domain
MANPTRSVDASELASELRGAELGDDRRSRRLAEIVERVARRPDASFPGASGSDAELEAIYRFLGNEHVSPEAILEPHKRASHARAVTHEDVLVVHDTTYFVFEGEREGLGRVHQRDQGFWGHFALAVGLDREAFGLVGLRYGTRVGPSKWRGSKRVKGVGDDAPSESMRWPGLVDDTAARFGRGRVVHVMDREADWFELLQHMHVHGERFVVRLTHDRLLEEGGRVSGLLAKAEAKATREVELSERAEGDRAHRRHPARKRRVAELRISAVSAALRSRMTEGVLQLNVVNVVEVNAPQGCEPVLWNLVTTEPVGSAEEVLRVVDAYRARWVIEEYFKALKTGCAFEKRQLASYASLLNALAVLAPVAWSLLRLRDTGRRRADRPGRDVLDPRLLAILVRIARRPVPENPSARDVMYGVAGLAGHLPRNGDPGWMTLGRGYERLLEAARVAELLDAL